MRAIALCLFAAAIGLSCRSKGQDDRTANALPACEGPVREGPLHWFVDDYNAALACAKRSSRPLVIDMWAPWCHTCLSMKHTVLQEDALRAVASQFVFVALDTDREQNAAAVAKFPPAAWPTFFVVDPSTEAVTARFVGAATVTQWMSFLQSGAPAATDAWTVAARMGDALAGAGKHAEAARAYADALSKAPSSWLRRSDVTVSLVTALADAGDDDGCANAVIAHADGVVASASVTDLFVSGLRCAGKLTDKALADNVRALAQENLRRLIADTAAPLSADDRSDAMMNLRELLTAAGDVASARELALQQKRLLDAAADRATDPFAKMTYNWPRAEVYAALDIPLDLVTDLAANAKALPSEYDPPYRLAYIYFRAGKFDMAQEWVSRAEALAYGPRKVRVQEFAAQVAAAAGNSALERAILERLLSESTGHATLPAVQGARNRAAQRLAATLRP